MFIYNVYNISCSLLSGVTWQLPFHCIISIVKVKSLFMWCWDQLHHKQIQWGMYLYWLHSACVGWFTHCLHFGKVCLELCTCYAGAWVAGHHSRATQTNAVLLQNGFSHSFIVVTCPYKLSVMCLSPTTTTAVYFSHEVIVVGIHMNACSQK